MSEGAIYFLCNEGCANYIVKKKYEIKNRKETPNLKYITKELKKKKKKKKKKLLRN